MNRDSKQTATRDAREAVAAFMIRNSFATGHGDTLEYLLGELEVQVQELRSARAEGKAS